MSPNVTGRRNETERCREFSRLPAPVTGPARKLLSSGAPTAVRQNGFRPRFDSLDVHRPVCKLLRRPEPVRRPVERTFFYRPTKFAMRRAIPVLLVAAAR